MRVTSRNTDDANYGANGSHNRFDTLSSRQDLDNSPNVVTSMLKVLC